MDFRQLRAYAPALFESGATVYLEGPPGCGKSEFVASLPRVVGSGIGFHKIDASVLDPGEIPGFVAPVKDEDGEGIAAYLRSALMPSKEYLEQHPRGIYFVDELAATVPAVRHGLDAVLNERRFGPRTLPSGWMVWSAGNRTKDFAGAQHLESKTLNRMSKIEVDVNVDHWVEDFALPAKLDPIGVAFLQTNPKVLANEVPDNREPFCTLRSFTKMLRFWEHVSENLRHNAFEIVGGYIGRGAAAEFIAYHEMSAELPSMQEIVESPQRAKVPKKLDMAYAAQMCAVRAGLDGYKLDPCWQYIERLPSELHLPAAKQWANAIPKRMSESQSLASYIAKNAPEIIEILK